MPQSILPASSKTRPDSSPRLGGRGRVRAAAILIGLTVLFPAAAMQPVAADAARSRSCTGWTSTTVPPRTIRVGRKGGRGTVQTVNFRRYVATVMAKEWPQYLPPAAMEAGAVAVKQYAWYHALAGHHRRGFRTASGRCFDVVDSTRDQLYKPELVGRAHARIWRAVDATWGLSVRKNGKFFMTGYRRGTVNRCGASADGRRLFARGVIACARQGKSRQSIQRRYYGANARFVWSTRSGRGSSISASAGSELSAPGMQRQRNVATERPVTWLQLL